MRAGTVFWDTSVTINPQVLPSQVAVPPADGHGVQEPPQVATSVLLAHAPLQM
jgi:hypothetical protein